MAKVKNKKRTPMAPAVKAQWLEALRDGSYKRTIYVLQDLANAFDPVGVLCDLAVKAGVQEAPKRYDKESGAEVFFGYQYQDGKHKTATRAPKAVWEWAGISYWTCNHIQMMSDKGASFKTISDWIEENL